MEENTNVIFYNGAFDQSIAITCDQLQNNINLDELLLDTLKREVGDKCIKHGYIKKNSIKINKRSIGTINSSRFDGSMVFDISYTAEVCNPTIGQVVKCRVKSKNKMGLLAESHPIIVVVSDQNNISNTSIQSIKIDDLVNIKLIGVRYDLYDNNITAIGTIQD